MRFIFALLSFSIAASGVTAAMAKGVPHTPNLEPPLKVKPAGEISKAFPKTEFDEHTKKHVAAMLKCFKAGDIKGALAEANKAIEASPKSAPLYMNRAAMKNFLSQKRDNDITEGARLKLKEEALADLYKSKELGLFPKVAGSQIGLQHLSIAAFMGRSDGAKDKMKEHVQKAYDVLKAAYEEEPKIRKIDDQIYMSMMNALMLQSNYQKVVDMCVNTDRIESMEPEFQRLALFAKATALKRLGKDEEAVAALKEAKETGLKLPKYEKALKDSPLNASSAEKEKLEKEFAPLIEKARAGLPDVKTRFLNGLYSGEKLYMTVKLYDEEGQYEQVFIRVQNWKGDKLTGTLANVVRILPNYKQGDKVEFAEKEIVDWTIVKPDGSEEGNLIGKFIDKKREQETGKKPELLNKESHEQSDTEDDDTGSDE